MKLNAHSFLIFNDVQTGSSKMFWITEEKTCPGFGEKKYKEYCAIFAKNVAHVLNSNLKVCKMCQRETKQNKTRQFGE